ncbi:MAG: ribosomal protein S18-alanine N-acetyltransferase [Asticcacaulis sp.]|nr:ribosomal protein S18-alanine N-acetyltransferase [Asticcacaulis sp.]
MIRRVVEADAAVWVQLTDIHAASFERGWSAAELQRMAAAAHNRLYVFESEGAWMSFLLLTAVAGEGEILTVATAPQHRGQGHAGRLLAHAAQALAAENAEAICLEVAVDNGAARALYDRAGFKAVGLRKAYYARAGGPAVDACILRLALA